MKTRYLTKTIQTSMIHAIARKHGWDEDSGDDAPMDWVEMDEAEGAAVFKPFDDREEAMAYAEAILPENFFGAVMVYLEHWNDESDDWIATGYWEVSKDGPMWNALDADGDFE